MLVFGAASQAAVTVDMLHSKTLTNNAVNNLFTFPLADGEGAGFTLDIDVIAKKSPDIGADSLVLSIAVFNVSGVLSKSISISGQLYSTINTAGITNMGNSVIDAALSGGVCTISVNPGAIAGSPTSIVGNYLVQNLTTQTITYL